MLRGACAAGGVGGDERGGGGGQRDVMGLARVHEGHRLAREGAGRETVGWDLLLGQWEYRVFEKAVIVLVIVGFYRCLSYFFFWGILSHKNKFWTGSWSI